MHSIKTKSRGSSKVLEALVIFWSLHKTTKDDLQCNIDKSLSVSFCAMQFSSYTASPIYIVNKCRYICIWILIATALITAKQDVLQKWSAIEKWWKKLWHLCNGILYSQLWFLEKKIVLCVLRLKRFINHRKCNNIGKSRKGYTTCLRVATFDKEWNQKILFISYIIRNL